MISSNSLAEYILFVIVSLVFVILFYKMIRLKVLNTKILRELVQSEIDNDILKNDLLIKNSQEYVNFVAKSRDEAYSYIQEVCLAFENFEKATSKTINHFDEFGIVASGSPLHAEMQTMVDAYKELKKAFPENSQND